jgi:hypothetical protein
VIHMQALCARRAALRLAYGACHASPKRLDELSRIRRSAL